MNREVLHIGVMEKGATRVLKLTGELDSYTSDRLTGISRTWIHGAQKVIVNLDGLDYIDSSGLAALVGMWVKAKYSGTQMVVSCQNARIQRVLEITGLLNLFKLDSTEVETKVTPDVTYSSPAIGPASELISKPKPPMRPPGIRR